MTHSVDHLIASARASGIKLWVENASLRFRAPTGAMTTELRNRLKSNRKAIIDRLRTENAPVLREDPEHRHEPFSLTDIQTAYLLGRSSSFQGGGTACHAYLEIDMGPIDRVRLETAFDKLIERHGMLRTSFHRSGYQQTHPFHEIHRRPITVVDDAQLPWLRDRLSHQILEADCPPLMELAISRGEHPVDDRLHLSIDFLIADWTSMTLMIDQLVALHADPHADLGPEGPSFRDYVISTELDEDHPRAVQDQRFWAERLKDIPDAPELPGPVPAAGLDGPASFTRHTHTLDVGATRRFMDLARSISVTPAALAMSGYARVLGEWAQDPEFTLIATILDRQPLHPHIDSLVGDFTSTGLVRIKRRDRTDADRARTIFQELADVLDHRAYSGVAVMRDLTRLSSGAQMAFPYVFTAAIDTARGHCPEQSQDWRITGGITQTPQVFVDCQVSVLGGCLCVNWDVRDGTIEPTVVDAMFQRFAAWLMGEASETLLGSDALLGRALGMAREEPSSFVGGGGCLHGRFFEVAGADPGRVAVIDAQGEHAFGDVARRALAVAAVLRDGGLRSGDRVLVSCPRGVGQVVAVLGVLAAGGCYVPVDVGHPRARRERIAEICGARVVVDEAWLARVPVLEDLVGVEVSLDPSLDAYVMFTSGTTGEPKGVVMTHAGAMNTIADVVARWGVTADDRALLVSSLGFDLSVFDLFGVLGRGGSLVIPPVGRYADPVMWAELVARYGVSVWNSAPAQVSMVLEAAQAGQLSSLRLVLVSGDWVPVDLGVRLWAHNPVMQVVALGGATEAGIWSNFHVVRAGDEESSSIPYGVALSGQCMDVVDGSWRARPDLVAGDIVISGGSLARCYESDPELTASKFVVVEGVRWYRTGDRGRWLPSGEIEFLGRTDTQVKIHGHRIELSEIDSSATRAVGVAQAITVSHAPRDETPRDLALTLFVIPDAWNSEFDEYVSAAITLARRFAAGHAEPGSKEYLKQIVAALAQRLAAYMSSRERHTMTCCEFARESPFAGTITPVIHGFDYQYQLFIPDPAAHAGLGPDMRFETHRWDGTIPRVEQMTSANLIIIDSSDPEALIRELSVSTGDVTCIVAATAQSSITSVHTTLSTTGVDAVHMVGEDADPMVLLIGTIDRSRSELVVHHVREQLAADLPPAWIPANICVLPALPLTVNGKIDREKLVKIADGLQMGAVSRELPGDESLSLDVCRSVLRRPELTSTDNLFAHGADSLIMAQLVTAVREQLEQARNLPFDTILRALMDDPRPVGLDSFLTNASAADRGASERHQAHELPEDSEHGIALMRMTGCDQGKLLTVMAPGALLDSSYLEPLAEQLTEGPVIGVRLSSPDWYLTLDPPRCLSELAQAIAPLVADLASDQVRVIGHSIGGFIAAAISGALADLGVETRAPVIINATPPTLAGHDPLLKDIFFLSALGLPPAVLGLQPEELMAMATLARRSTSFEEPINIPALVEDVAKDEPTLARIAERLQDFYRMSEERRLASYARNHQRLTGETIDQQWLSSKHALFSHSYEASSADPPLLLTDIHLVNSAQDNSYMSGVEEQRITFWDSATVARVRHYSVPGDHFSCVLPPLVKRLAETILHMEEEC